MDKNFDPQFLAPHHNSSPGSRQGLHGSTPNLSHSEFDTSFLCPQRHRSSKEELSPPGFGVDISTPRKSQTSCTASLDSLGADNSRSHAHSDRVATRGLVQAAKQARRFSLSRELSNDHEISEESDSQTSPVIPRLPSDLSSFHRAADKRKSPQRVKAFGPKGRRSYGNELDGGGAEGEDEEEDVDKLLEQMAKGGDTSSGTASPRRMDSAPGMFHCHRCNN